VPKYEVGISNEFDAPDPEQATLQFIHWLLASTDKYPWPSLLDLAYEVRDTADPEWGTHLVQLRPNLVARLDPPADFRSRTPA
jgi:hypothetical protein